MDKEKEFQKELYKKVVKWMKSTSYRKFYGDNKLKKFIDNPSLIVYPPLEKVLSKYKTAKCNILILHDYHKLCGRHYSKCKIYKMLAEKYGIKAENIEKRISKISKDRLIYNEDHFEQKDKLTRETIDIITKELGEINTILDAFAGEKSVYETPERLKEEYSLIKNTIVITNDKNRKGNTYQKDAKALLKDFIKFDIKFDLIDLDCFDYPPKYISSSDLLKLTNKGFLLTLGTFDRNKTSESIKKMFGIEFVPGVDSTFQILNKLNEEGRKMNKMVSLIKKDRYIGGTYRLAFMITDLI